MKGLVVQGNAVDALLQRCPTLGEGNRHPTQGGGAGSRGGSHCHAGDVLKHRAWRPPDPVSPAGKFRTRQQHRIAGSQALQSTGRKRKGRKRRRK